LLPDLDHETCDAARAPVDMRARAAWLGRHVIPHEPELRNWLRRREVRGLDVSDVVQEVYARLVALPSIGHIQNPKTYAFQAAASIVFTHARRLKVVPIVTLGGLDDMEIAAEEPSPEQVAADRDELRRLASALARLPTRVAEVFHLRRVEGLSQRDVAARLGIAESTVEKHMVRGVVMMADWFKSGGSSRLSPSKTVIGSASRHNGQRNR
jgi:RNA polymerase sigma factor (sigma-70 family)